jgi:hypothetical protein
MKEVLFKNSLNKYYTTFQMPYSNISEYSNSTFGDFVYKPDKSRPTFTSHQTIHGKKIFEENYGNPMCEVSKDYMMVVVEKSEDKISIKLFSGGRNRRPGVSWFKIYKNLDYVTVNIKTGDVYNGCLYSYHKKRKAQKRIRRNSFSERPLSNLFLKIKNMSQAYKDEITELSVNGNQIATDAISIFMYEIDRIDCKTNIDFNDRLFRYYLNARNIKYPNNFQAYANILVGPEIRQTLKKNGNRLVDAAMAKYKLSGKKLKSALHSCKNINLLFYISVKDFFGDNFLNQEDGLLIKLLESNSYWIEVSHRFKDFISNEEMKRVFEIFKQTYIHNTINNYTFHDHVRIYTQLKTLGERDIKWMSGTNTKIKFRDEHFEWSNKLSYYENGLYHITYPEYLFNMISKPIESYYPVLLYDTSNYNKESQIQSNCVKGYIGRPGCVIISLRKGSVDSEDRATIEYLLTKEKDKIKVSRFQTLGKFNKSLTSEWMEIILSLDSQLEKAFNDEKFDTIKLTKTFNNGVELNSNSYWNEEGQLKWENDVITQ